MGASFPEREFYEKERKVSEKGDDALPARDDRNERDEQILSEGLEQNVGDVFSIHFA